MQLSIDGPRRSRVRSIVTQIEKSKRKKKEERCKQCTENREKEMIYIVQYIHIYTKNYIYIYIWRIMSKYFLMRVASLGYYYINCKTLQLIDICICKRSFVFFDAVNKQKRKKELLLSLLLIN